MTEQEARDLLEKLRGRGDLSAHYDYITRTWCVAAWNGHALMKTFTTVEEYERWSTTSSRSS